MSPSFDLHQEIQPLSWRYQFANALFSNAAFFIMNSKLHDLENNNPFVATTALIRCARLWALDDETDTSHS